jgi:probable rRNA maturation factor
MRVDVASRVSRSPSPGRVRAILVRASRFLKSEIRDPKSEISILFCGDGKMRSLNRRYRGKDRPTDVLAFPAEGNGFLGDVVISVPYASRQARRRGEPASREIDRLLLHGLLHLCGYDHETDRGEMDALEASLRRRLRLEERRT